MSLAKNFKFWIIAISLIYFLFRIPFLGFDQTNNDSQRWFVRSEGYLQALKDFNFKETHQKYHPGVTLMFINSIFRQSFYSIQYSLFSSKINIMSAENFPITNMISKFGVIIVVFLVLLYQTSLIKKIWDSQISLIYFFFISTEPYFIGINRWFHLTSFEVVFGFTSVLLILLWLKERESKYFILSALFLAFGVLTKVTTLITGLVILFVLIKNYLENKTIKEFFTYLLLYLSFIFILYPALWVDMFATSLNIFGSILNAVGEDYRASQLNLVTNYFYYLLILLYKLSPLTLFLIIFIFVFKNDFLKKFENLVIFLVFLINFVFLSISDQKIDRYSLVFFSPILLLISIFVSSVSLKFKKLILSASFAFSIFVAVFYSFQFSAYYSPIFGGSKGALDLGIYENGGSYFNEAAFFLNKNYPGKNILVPDNYEAFSLFYNGKSQREKLSDTDFIVTSLDIDRKEFNFQNCQENIALFGPIDKKVVSIFKCR